MRAGTQEEEAAFQVALAAVLCESKDEERRKVEEEEVAYQARLSEAITLSTSGDCFVPPLALSSPVKPEPAPQQWTWQGEVREWVSAPSIWFGATSAQEQIYLEQWRKHRLTEERREGERLEQWERDAGKEEERRARAVQPATVTPAPQDVATTWESAFPWAGPTSTLIGLTSPDHDDEGASGSAPPPCF